MLYSKFLQNFLSTLLFFSSQVSNYNFIIFTDCASLSLTSGMTPCTEHSTDRKFNNSLKYYVLVRYYACHNQI